MRAKEFIVTDSWDAVYTGKITMTGYAAVDTDLLEDSYVKSGVKNALANLGIAGAIAAAGGAGIAAKNSLDDYVTKSQVSAPAPYVQTQPDEEWRQSMQYEIDKAVASVMDTQIDATPVVNPITNTKNEQTLLKTAIASGIKGRELAAFMAQMAHESQGFVNMIEDNPNIKRYGTGKTAQILGNRNMNDAERFIGRGFIQLTGRWNYKWMEKKLGIDLTSTWSAAQRAADPQIAAQIAVLFWKNRVQPNVSDYHDIRAVTKQINPGMKGMSSRTRKYNDYIASLG